MAQDVETEEVGTDTDTDDTDTDQGGDSAGGGEGGDKEPEKPAEPFLAIDERTVYKDPDSAKKGWQDLNAHLGRYRKLGKPEEIERRLAKAEAREELLKALETGTKTERKEAEESYLATLPDDKRKAWEASGKPIRELLKDDLGRIGKLEQELAELKRARETEKSERQTENLQRFRKRALTDLDTVLSENGKTLTAKQITRLEDLALATMQREDDEDGQALLQALNAEDSRKFAVTAARIYLGEEAIKSTPNGSKSGVGDGSQADERPRDPETGKFLSEEEVARRKKAAAADKASRLAKAPPEGGSATSEQGGKKQPPPLQKRAGMFAQAVKAAMGKG